jgi:hypothetical protein
VTRAPRLAKIIVGRLEDRLDPDPLVDRHQSIAQLIVGSVQRDGQIVRLAALGQLADLVRQSDRGNRDAASAQAQSPFFVESFHRGQERLEVGQRLADPHHHDVRDAFVGAH